MKIKIEDFNKLKQQDRIEYLLKLNQVGKLNLSFNFTFWVVLVILIVLTEVLFLGMYNADFISIEILRSIFNSFEIFTIIIFCLVVVDLICSIIYYFHYLKHKRELREEYFEIKVK